MTEKDAQKSAENEFPRAEWADSVDEDFRLNPREWLDMAVSDYAKALKMVEDMHDEEGPALRLELARVGLLVARELREQA